MKPSVSYKKFLMREMKNRERALGYLRAALEDKDQRVFLIALRDVAEAQGGLAQLARTAQLSREHLYDMLSRKGNPEFLGLQAVLDALGFKLSVESKKPRRLKKAA